jgi:26S proteasome regulatory subunit N3
MFCDMLPWLTFVLLFQAMRFPMNQHRLELKNAQEAREREREMAKEIQDGDLDEDDLGGEFEGM